MNAFAKALQGEVFLSVVRLRETMRRLKEVTKRRAEGESLIHSDHLHDFTLGIYSANLSRIGDIPSKIGMMLQVFNHNLIRQNGLSALLDRKFAEFSRNAISKEELSTHYDEHLSEIDEAIKVGSLLNELFEEEFPDTKDFWMTEGEVEGTITFQIVRKSKAKATST